MRNIDVLLVKPGSQKKLYGKLSDFGLTALEPPLWASLLAGHLRNLGCTVALYDAEVEGWSYDETARRIQEVNPLLAVISVSGTNPSASTMNMTGAGLILKQLKNLAPTVKTMLHGIHPSALPERTLMEETVDFVCQGEGFHTLPWLVNSLKAGGRDHDIQGLWYKREGKAYGNPPAPLLQNLDELPMPAWDLLLMKKYRAHNWHCFDNIKARQPYGIIYTSLGCPFRCNFCCINAIFGNPGIRYRSPENVVAEIDYLVNHHNIRNIKIIDEMFALNETRVSRLCNLIIERRYNLNMWAYARINTITPIMLDKMKQAGINWVAYGFESGNQKVLEGVSKGVKVLQMRDIVKMTYDAGLYIVANFMFGLPEDDFDSMQDTLSLAMDINAEWGNFYTTMAYPGSKLYLEAVRQGWELPETWQGYSQYSYDSFPLRTKYLSSAQVLSFRDYAFQAYFTNPRYLDKIKRFFGEQTKHHLQEMSSQRLNRKLEG